MWRSEPDSLRRGFLHFSEMCEGIAPLYAALSRGIADDGWMLNLARRSQEGQPPPNMLFGAVHFLLLSGVDHPLAAFYPSLRDSQGRSTRATRPSNTQKIDQAWPAFVDFCRRRQSDIARLVSTRRVQTNVVGRCGMLLPAFGIIARSMGRAPLGLIEVGASAGLNLLFDRYRYEYSDGQTCGPFDSPVRMTIDVRGDTAPPVPRQVPQISARTGIDIDPVDVADADAMRWVEAMIWPDDVDRIALHRAAVTIARADPPQIIKGDALEALSSLVNDSSPTAFPVIVHSHAIYQMSRQWRASFAGQIDELGANRDLADVSLEWLDPDLGPQLRLTIFSNGNRSERHLASCHHHGRWIEWLA